MRCGYRDGANLAALSEDSKYKINAGCVQQHPMLIAGSLSCIRNEAFGVLSHIWEKIKHSLCIASLSMSRSTLTCCVFLIGLCVAGKL